MNAIYFCHVATDICPISRKELYAGQKEPTHEGARAAAGLSQADLAQAVGVTRQTIGLIEAGGYNPTLNLCVAVCKALRVTLNDLFWDDEIKADPNAL